MLGRVYGLELRKDMTGSAVAVIIEMLFPQIKCFFYGHRGNRLFRRVGRIRVNECGR
jgi:hypothetical protein